MKPRTKLAIIQNCFIGLPVIVILTIFNAATASNPSPLVHSLGTALLGFGTSFFMLYVSLQTFKIRSKYDGGA